MLRIGVALAFLVLLLGDRLEAGAWPREPGRSFLSFRIEDGGDAAIYGERGLTRRVTVGGQIARGERHEASARYALPAPRSGRTSAFLRYALGSLDAADRFAVSLGVSAPPDVMGAATHFRLEAGLHWGRGFESRWGGGWATATARVMRGREESRPVTDINALVGIRPAEGTMAMLSLARYADGDGTHWTLTPSAGYELGPEVWLVPHVGISFGDHSDTTAGLSLWVSF